MDEQPITNIPDFVHTVLDDARPWGRVFPWFRGERNVADSTLLPQVFRKKYDENNLLQTFRRRAHLLNLPVIPPVSATDQWLFLARHVGLPTRLLDWTEGALIGLYFALSKVEEYERGRQEFKAQKQVPPAKGVVWMLQPMRLNWLAEAFEKETSDEEVVEPQTNYYGLTWYDPVELGKMRVGRNIAFENIAAAWEQKRPGRGIQMPVAIEPTTIHPRMNAQHSYFTVHGLDERPLHEILPKALARLREKKKCSYQLDDLLRKYEITIPPSEGIAELRALGVADSTIMPDADSLAKELSRFMRDP